MPEPRADIHNHFGGVGAGDTSRIETSQLLFSSPQPPNYGGESTWMSGGMWSEARPCLGVGNNGMGVHGNVGGQTLGTAVWEPVK